jgi:hypothetical protein
MTNPQYLMPDFVRIEMESPERGTSEDLERKARSEGERNKK